MQCKEKFKTVTELNEHNEKSVCILCNRHFNSIDEAKEHKKKHYTCKTCKQECCNRHDLFFHQNNQHGGEELQAWPEDMWGNDQELREIMEGNKLTILRNHTKEDPKWVYNFPTNGLAGHNQELTEHLRTIYHEMESKSYKINFIFGLI